MSYVFTVSHFVHKPLDASGCADVHPSLHLSEGAVA